MEAPSNQPWLQTLPISGQLAEWFRRLVRCLRSRTQVQQRLSPRCIWSSFMPVSGALLTTEWAQGQEISGWGSLSGVGGGDEESP